MKAITKYLAFDDTSFDTADACKAYEAKHVETRVAGLTVDQVRAAVAGKDAGLRDALEEIGRRCSVARREAGEFRRQPKARAAEATKAADTQPQTDREVSPDVQ